MVGATFLATAFVLLFEYPHAYQPQPSHFLVTATQAGLTDTLRVSRGDAAQCTRWQGSGPDTVCATWPGCPAPGVMTLHLQAAWGDVLGTATGEITCQFTALAPCECQPVVPPPLLPVPTTTPVATGTGTGGVVITPPTLTTPTLPLWTMPTHPAAT